MPPDAFEFFASLGANRSLAAVARRYDVTSRAVRKRAAKEDWQRRIEEIDLKAREAIEKRTVETVSQMNERHLRAMRVIQGKALEALKSLSLDTAMDAIRAIDLATKQERLIRGEPGERTAVSIEETVRREYQRWLIVPAADAKTVESREVGEALAGAETPFTERRLLSRSHHGNPERADASTSPAADDQQAQSVP